MNEDAGYLVRQAIAEVLPLRADMVIEREGRRTWRVRAAASATGYVVKLYHRNASGFMCEIRALRRLRETAAPFCVPGITRYGILPGSTTRFVIMTEVQGCTLDERVREGRYGREEALSLVGHLLAGLHESAKGLVIDPVDVCEGLTNAGGEHIRILESVGEVAVASFARATRRWFERNVATPSRSVFCHGDLHLKNIIIGSNGDATRGVVDFECARAAPPEFDVAKSIVVTGATDASESAAILAGYGDSRIDEAALAGYKALHAIDGWVYGALREQRDRALWDRRLMLYAANLRT